MTTGSIEVFANCYGEYGLKAAIDHAPRVGVTELEVGLQAHSGHLVVPAEMTLTTATPPEGIRQAQEWMRQAGVSVTTCYGGADVSTAEGREHFRALLDLAAKLGARWFTCDMGHPDDKRVLYDGMAEMGDYAQAKGLLICLETHPPLVTNAGVGLETLRDLSHPNIRINWDTGNIYYYNEGIDGEAELEKVAAYVGHVHLKDCRKGHREWFFPALGDGIVDLGRVRRILADAGFTGPYSIEIEGVAGEQPLTLAEREENVRRSLEHLRGL
ncbi:MAG: sugar phosphate isomerase/epimerase family protein, partial [Anaerolineae bacterium]